MVANGGRLQDGMGTTRDRHILLAQDSSSSPGFAHNNVIANHRDAESLRKSS